MAGRRVFPYHNLIGGQQIPDSGRSSTDRCSNWHRGIRIRVNSIRCGTLLFGVDDNQGYAAATADQLVGHTFSAQQALPPRQWSWAADHDVIDTVFTGEAKERVSNTLGFEGEDSSAELVGQSQRVGEQPLHNQVDDNRVF